ncbi:hypothetical protein MRX96_032317 [Rhipicephalus microplus]
MPLRSHHHSDPRHKRATGGPDTSMAFDLAVGHGKTTIGEAHGILDKSRGVAKASLSIIFGMTTFRKIVQIKGQIFYRTEVAIGECSSEYLVMPRDALQ